MLWQICWLIWIFHFRACNGFFVWMIITSKSLNDIYEKVKDL
ncbi:hypothetical protein Patl1_33424 [Pistacia atlantica]|uniref:Uncharacterized protein n=1 Tax=Pistacia atlantica TaxID=434234 RepID=A0ACC0ZV16_9ROSI|nr:hypothetical protein Patl1_33424 [Pistacia atlantica]